MTQINITVKPFVMYTYEVIAREDKGWDAVLGIDWNRAKQVSFQTVKSTIQIEKPKRKIEEKPTNKTFFGLITIYVICVLTGIMIIIGAIYKKCFKNKS